MIKKHKIKIAFLAGLLILLVLASIAVNPGDGEVYDIISVKKKLFEIKHEEQNTIDVLFTGDSLVFRDISPLRIWNETGITSYDISEGAMRLCDQCLMVKEFCKKQSPELLVLEADIITKDASPFKDDFALPTNLVESIFPIFHYHTFYKAFEPFDNEDFILIRNKGYDPVDTTEPYEGPSDYMEAPSKPVAIGALNLKYLEDLSDYCRNQNIALLVLSLPSPGNYNGSTHKAVQEWADSHNAPYLDMNLMWEEIGIDWSTDTKDGGDHLNSSGAEKVSIFLAEYLEENYELPDHRNDEAYDSWNRDFDKLYD